MIFIRASGINELGPGGKMKVVLKNKEILLANLDGTYYAIENTCPHMGGSLSDGKIEGNTIVCPKHGAIFDITNGHAVKNGKLLFITAKVSNIKSYPVRIEGSDIMVGLE